LAQVTALATSLLLPYKVALSCQATTFQDA